MSRTYTPPLRSDNPPGPAGNFTASEVDGIMQGLAGVANASAVVKLVADSTARLALGSAVQVGDFALEAGGNLYLLKALPASSSGNWQQVNGGGGSDPTLQWIAQTPWNPPQLADFTEVKNGGGKFGIPLSTAHNVTTQGNKGIHLDGGAASSVALGWEILVNPFTPVLGDGTRAAIIPIMADLSSYAGLILRNSTSGKFIFAGLYDPFASTSVVPVVRVEQFNADGTSAGTLVGDSPKVHLPYIVYLNLFVSTSTGYQFSIGTPDGVGVNGPSFDIAAFLGSVDQVGVGVSNSGTNFSGLSWLHWEQSY